jgi:hypothetical protein
MIIRKGAGLVNASVHFERGEGEIQQNFAPPPLVKVRAGPVLSFFWLATCRNFQHNAAFLHPLS